MSPHIRVLRKKSSLILWFFLDDVGPTSSLGVVGLCCFVRPYTVYNN